MQYIRFDEMEGFLFCIVLLLGLGAPESFLQSDNEQVLLDVYHRYQLYQKLVGTGAPGHYEAECDDSCPQGSHCVWGICFCDTGSSLSS